MSHDPTRRPAGIIARTFTVLLLALAMAARC